jgi:hypothetical protein
LEEIKAREGKERRNQTQKERKKSEWGRPKEKLGPKGKKYKGEGKAEGREIILGFSSCTTYRFPFTSVHFADCWENIRIEWNIKQSLEISRKEMNKCQMLVTHFCRVDCV